MHRKEPQQPQRIAYLLRSCPQALKPTAVVTARPAQSDATEPHGERMMITVYHQPLAAQRRGRNQRGCVKFYCKKIGTVAQMKDMGSEVSMVDFFIPQKARKYTRQWIDTGVEEHCYESVRMARSTQL